MKTLPAELETSQNSGDALLRIHVDGHRVRVNSVFQPGTEVGDLVVAFMTRMRWKTREAALRRVLKRARISGAPGPDAVLAVCRVLGKRTPKELEADLDRVYKLIKTKCRHEEHKAEKGPGYYRKRDGLDVPYDPQKDQRRPRPQPQLVALEWNATKRAIARLKPRDRRVMDLVAEGHLAPEIALRESITPANARKRIQRARANLKALA